MILLFACASPDAPFGDTSRVEDSADSAEPAPTGTGLVTWEGQAAVDAGWVGTEAITFRAELGLGEVLCEVLYPVTSVAPRTDCGDCSLAFDVLLGAPEVLVPDACEAAGYPEDVLATIEGTRRAYGYALDYFGHANVLLVDEGAGWDAAAFADFDQVQATIAYSWDRGYLDY